MKLGLLALLAVAFVPFGGPRWLDRGAPTATAHPDARYAQLCRNHGGTPRIERTAGATQAQRSCHVSYGGHDYAMDAITLDGFDEDTAHYQQLGCEQAQQQQKALPPARRHAFVYHVKTGVCEQRA